MLIVHVHVSVKPEFVDAFREATKINSRESLKEAGVARFDLVQQIDAPAQFIIVEAYRDEEAPVRHKETPHYQVWRDTVAPMMAKPRTSVKYSNVCPPDTEW